MKQKRSRRSPVHLIGYDSADRPLFELELSLQQYSEGQVPILDDPAFRRAHGIVRLSGSITDDRGAQIEMFEVRFDRRTGIQVRDAARFADGTVVGDGSLLPG
jgi:hypothetical protein